MTPTDFFKTLWPDDLPGNLLIWTLPDKKSYWFDDVEQAGEQAGNLNGHDVYFGCGLGLKDYGPNCRAKANQISAIPGLWADLDVAGPGHKDSRKVLFEDRQAALAWLRGLPVYPNMVIWSGGGLHCYWLFNEPWEIEGGTDRRDVQRVVGGWVGYLQKKASEKGYSIDSVQDLSRVLRVPGTVNHKRGCGEPVTVISQDATRFNPDDFDDYLVEPVGKVGAVDAPVPVKGGFKLDPAAEPPAMKFFALYENEVKFKKSWNRTRNDLKDTSASSYDLALANYAAMAQWSDQEIVNLLIASRRQHGDNLKLRDDYYSRTVGRVVSARDKVRDEEAAEEDAKKEIDGIKAEAAEVVAKADARQEKTGRRGADAGSKDHKQAEKLILRITGANVAKIEQHGESTESIFTAELSDSRKIVVGNAVRMLDIDTWKTIALTHWGGTFPVQMKRAEWERLAVPALMSITTVVVSEEAELLYQVDEWIDGLMEVAPDVTGLEKSDYDMAMPFIEKGVLYFTLGSLEKQLCFSNQHKGMKRNVIISLLKLAGYVSKVKAERIEGATRSKRLWRKK